ncbi:MAG: lasso peptide biosynthesis B2 protein [Steroidobacteraceae bacterium]
MPPYLLLKHVYACLSGEQLVLLDLKADRYFALECTEAAALAPLVRGWPVQADGSGGGDETMVRELLSRSLLTQDESAGKDAMPVAVDTAEAELFLDDTVPLLNARRVTTALVATTRAAVLMRCTALARIVRGVSRRKRLRGGAPAPAVEELRELVSVFDYLRPFLFSARDGCLLDCLALSEFLAPHGLFPTWVFGVRTKPFAAHCWLQHDGVLLNDCIERTGSFTPIMTV